ncbi:MAG: hypothetical protein ACRDYC_07050 [Acidimicrobiales bacterium]
MIVSEAVAQLPPPLQMFLDVGLFIPLGIAVEAVERGGRQVGQARVVGRFAVAQGRRQLAKGLAGLTDSDLWAPPGRRAPSAPEQYPPVGERPLAEDLPIPGYDSLSALQVVPRLAGLTPSELEAVRAYEVGGRGRRTILSRIAQLQAS